MPERRSRLRNGSYRDLARSGRQAQLRELEGIIARPVRRLRTVIARAQAPEVCLRLERVSACLAALEEIFLFSSSPRWVLINLPLVNAGCPGKRWLRPSSPSAPLMLWIVSYRFDARTTQHRR